MYLLGLLKSPLMRSSTDMMPDVRAAAMYQACSPFSQERREGAALGIGKAYEGVMYCPLLEQ